MEEVVLPIITLVLGWGLNEFSQWYRGQRKDRDDVVKYRAALRLEMKHNLDQLNKIWEQTSQLKGSPILAFFIEDIRPIFSRTVWDSDTKKISALSVDEVNSTMRFYQNLLYIQEAYDTLLRMTSDEDPSQIQTGLVWDRVVETMKNISHDNPITGQTPHGLNMSKLR